MSPIILGLATLAGIFLGVLAGYFIRKIISKSRMDTAEQRVEKIMIEAKNKEKEILLQAKEKAIKTIEEAKQEENQRRSEIKSFQDRLEKRETMFDQKLIEFEDKKTRLQQKIDDVGKIKEEIEKKRNEASERLQSIAKLSIEQAKEELMKHIEEHSKHDLSGRIMKLEKENSEVYEEKARELILDALQRTATNHASETTSTVVNLTNDEMKGRIIGKDGRNIKTIEKLTGCELIIDETPDVIMISGFSPIRRRVCYLALDRMIKDGVIHPTKIEQSVEDAKKELALDIKKAGEEALYKLGFTGIDPKLVSIVGRLKYRTSYGQNVLNHSIEVAYLSGIIAEELGCVDPIKAKKAGFFHDIGKAVDQETQGSHTEIGFTILKKFGLDEDTQDAAMNHHEDKPEKVITQIVKAADAISASRVGARRDTYENYVARLEELERTASDFPGIEKVYAIQAGREVRVFVKPSEIDDYQSYNLAKDIARKIESELQYPGEIKVNVIRETRIVEYAK